MCFLAVLSSVKMSTDYYWAIRVRLSINFHIVRSLERNYSLILDFMFSLQSISTSIFLTFIEKAEGLGTLKAWTAKRLAL